MGIFTVRGCKSTPHRTFITYEGYFIDGNRTATQSGTGRREPYARRAGGKSGVSIKMIKRLEKMDGRLSGNVRTIEAVRSALEQRGVTFEPDNGKGAGLRFFGGDGAKNGRTIPNPVSDSPACGRWSPAASRGTSPLHRRSPGRLRGAAAGGSALRSSPIAGARRAR